MTTPDKIAVVTGCSPGGIGFYLAKELQQRGYRVFATTRKGAAIPDLEGVEVLSLEVTDLASVKAAAAEVERKAGGLDLLINNAGHGGGRCPLLDVDIDQAKELYDANVWGLVRTTQAFVPLMLKNGPPPAGRKRVVNIGSIVGLRAMPFMSVYGSSKHAVHGLNDSLRLELANLGVSVTLVAPGLIATNFGENSSANQPDIPEKSFYHHNWQTIRGGSLGTGTEVGKFAKGVVDAITAHRAPEYYFGGASSTAVRMLTHFPSWIFDSLLRKRTGAAAVEYKP